jgi:ketosteroid isomerase-like protein
MVEAEKKFYETGQEKGTRAAFLEFLAPDAIIFGPGPVNGQDAWSKRPERGLDLVWEPIFAAIARSGDFGYDTGPAKWRAKKTDEKFFGHGQFVSIWKKQKGGAWKVALDCGIEYPEPAGKPETLRVFVPDTSVQAKIDAPGRRKALEEIQRTFFEPTKGEPLASATLRVAAKDIRVYHDGSSPAVGKEAAGILLNATNGYRSCEPMGGDISNSADLAYSYGKYSIARKDTGEAGHYLQIWQTDATGAWKLALDWQQPLPKP